MPFRNTWQRQTHPVTAVSDPVECEIACARPLWLCLSGTPAMQPVQCSQNIFHPKVQHPLNQLRRWRQWNRSSFLSRKEFPAHRDKTQRIQQLLRQDLIFVDAAIASTWKISCFPACCEPVVSLSSGVACLQSCAPK